MKTYQIEPRVHVGLADTIIDPVEHLIDDDKKPITVGTAVKVEWFLRPNEVRTGLAEIVEIIEDEFGFLLRLRPDWDTLQ